MSDRENGTKDSDDDSPVVSKRRSRSSRSSSSVSRSRSRSRRRYSRSRSRSGSRRRYYSRSRSRSPYYRRRRSRYYSRSRSRSYSPYNRYRSSSYRSRYRSRSRSPMSNRRRHLCSREDPKVSRCVGVFGLSLYTQERDLKEVFSRYGPLEEVQVVYDHQTGRSRGFAFLYFRNIEDAMEAKEMAPGTEIDGRKIRVDYSITERAHTPTPGIYLGKTTGYRSYRRSRSPYSYRRGYSRSRSRSRSYSPRRYSRLKKENLEVWKNET